MTNDQPPPSQPGTGVTMLLIVIGVILLLPGLCTLVFAAQILATEDIVRLATRDPYFQPILVLWIVCLLISTGGILLLRHAGRRARRARGP